MDFTATENHDELSDYGSDFTPDEEEILSGLLSPAPDHDLDKDADSNQLSSGTEQYERSRSVRFTLGSGCEQQIERSFTHSPERRRINIQYDGEATTDQNFESPESRFVREGSASIDSPLDPKPEKPDLRSPLERFRTKPRKALSVTDLVSPSWCGLQYWYTLTKHGKKRRTPAMKQGSAVHKVLEDQVHTTVKVDVTTKEDAWGLRIWNVIQGLKTLRETGMTRELEIWGTVDGLVVNGVIDELSKTCPDLKLEEESDKGKSKAVPGDQTTIIDFLGGRPLETNDLGILRNNGLGAFQTIHGLHKKAYKIYITDVKTRSVRSVPKAASFRPTLMQLMLYHKLLSDLATNRVDADLIFERYNLRPNALFSDSFIAQMGNLNENYHDTSPDPSQGSSTLFSTRDSMTILLSHNSLRSLWGLMISEFALTMPLGTKSIGNILNVEYRSQSDGTVMGTKAVLFDENTITTYLDDEMRWWKGEREAQGVCVEEAYKCGSCDFFAECSWRKNKIEEATNKMRARTKSSV